MLMSRKPSRKVGSHRRDAMHRVVLVTIVIEVAEDEKVTHEVP
jgi:hypothetical protein